MFFGLLFKLGFQRSQFLRVFLGQINSLGVVVIEVIELPGIFIKSLFALGISSDKAAWVGQFSFPPIVIDRSRTKNVVILQRVTGRCFGIVYRVCQGSSLNGILLDSLDLRRSLDSYKI